jgi:hypothetical protein
MTATTPTMTLAQVIDVLRNHTIERGNAPTVAQVLLIREDILNCVPVEQTLARPELVGFTIADVMSVAEEFGKHRARVHKRSLDKPSVMTADESGMLIPATNDELRNVHTLPKRKRERLVAAMGPQILEGEWLVLPRGWERTAEHGRDIAKSLAALAAGTVSDTESVRFVSRHYDEPVATLDADHVTSLHWIARNGLAVKLLEIGGLKRDADGNIVDVGGGNSGLVGLLVEAHDLLEVARLDALDALGVLVRRDTEGLAELRNAVHRASWLAPSDLGRIGKLLEQIELAPGNERLRTILSGKLANFAMWVRSNPTSFALTGVECLTSAHLTQILASSGLAADESEEKAVTSELRARLTEMGLTNDLDREIPEGLRAWRVDRLEEFYSSRQARVDGDPEWKLLYEIDRAMAEELSAV